MVDPISVLVGVVSVLSVLGILIGINAWADRTIQDAQRSATGDEHIVTLTAEAMDDERIVITMDGCPFEVMDLAAPDDTEADHG